jgi:hypothetical protein
MAKVHVLPGVLSAAQWSTIAATLPDGADLIWARRAWQNLVRDLHEHSLASHVVRRRALSIYAGAGGTITCTNPRKWLKRTRPRSPEEFRPEGHAVTYLQVCERQIWGRDLSPHTARHSIKKFRKPAPAGLTVGPPMIGAPVLRQVHHLTAVDLIVGSPVLGKPSLNVNGK